MPICTVCGNYETDKETTCGMCGYELDIVWKKSGSDYVEDWEATRKRRSNASTSRTVEPYEPFEGDDGRMAYRDENGRIHKEYIDKDDRDNDPDYWI